MILKKITILIRNIVCFISLFFLSPLLIIAASIIIIEDGFPAFFVQKRIGLDKNTFKIIKIRTLKKNTPNIGTHELKNSSMLKNGSWIRKIKLDEFPQLINVLKGELNLVGPRPGLVSQEKLQKERSLKNVFIVKPGITGLAQILGYDMSDPKKLAEIDEAYIINRSIFLDLLIIMGTFFNFPKKSLKKRFKIC